MSLWLRLDNCKNEEDFDNILNDVTLEFNNKCNEDIVLVDLNNKFTLICNVSDYNLISNYLKKENLLIDNEFYIKVKDISKYFRLFNFDGNEFKLFMDSHPLLQIYHRRDVIGNQVGFESKMHMIKIRKKQFKEEQINK